MTNKILILLEDKKPRGYYGPSNIISTLESFIGLNLNFDVKIIDLLEIQKMDINFLKVLKDFLINLKIIFNGFWRYDLLYIHYFKGFHYLIYTLIPGLLKTSILQIYFPLRPIWVKLLNIYIKKFIVMNPYMFKYLSNIGINESKIEIIPPPIDIDFYKPLNREKLLLKYEIPHDKTIILYHGRTATVRGLMMFLNTLKDLKNEKNLFAVLSLADLDDEDMSVNDVEDYIQKEGLENITKRFIGKNNPLEMYNLADIVVFPFLTAGAAICPPLSVLEAMSCGKVVVTSNIEELGLNYIIKNNQNGFLINPTEKDLIKCIKDLKFKDDNNLKKIEFNARASIEKSYSIKVVAEKILTISEELC